MIGEKEIITSIATLLKENFNEAQVHTRNTKEGFKKTCFFIEAISPESETIGVEMEENRISIRLTYFPINDRQTKELWDVKRKLQNIFRTGLQVNPDFHITYEDPISFNYAGTGNLEMLLALHFVQEIEDSEPDGEMLEELEVAFGEE